MIAANELMLLARMEAARRQTRTHLDLVERQIEGRAERSAITARVKGRPVGRDRAAWTPGDDRLFHEHLERLVFAPKRERGAIAQVRPAGPGHRRTSQPAPDRDHLRGLKSARSQPSRTGGHHAALYGRNHLSPSRLSSPHL